MQRLILLSQDDHPSLLPLGQDRGTIRNRLSRLLTASAGPESAQLFAAVEQQGTNLAFLAPPGRIARFDELDDEGRVALRAEIGRLVSELRRAAIVAAQRDPADADLPALVVAAIEVPSFQTVFAHEGRPILAGWGMTIAGVPQGQHILARLDDSLPPPFPPVWFSWPVLSTAVVVLLVIAAGAVAAAPYITRWAAPQPMACRADPGSLEAMKNLLREQEHENDLRRQLAALQTDIGHRRLACPLRAQTAPSAAPVMPQSDAVRPSRNVQPCDQETHSGGRGITRTRHFLGSNPGRVRLVYDMARQPDEIRVYFQGHIIAGTGGPVSFAGEQQFDWNPPSSDSAEAQVVEVEVIGSGVGTRWMYKLSCPDGRR